MTSTTKQRVGFTVSGVRITWICTGCGEPVRPRTGYLEVDDGEAYRRHIQHAEEDRQRSSWEPVDLRKLLDGPGPVPWLAWHRRCDPNPDTSTYWIDVGRINTLRRLIHWAGHLGTKNWIGETDWTDLLRRIGDDA